MFARASADNRGTYTFEKLVADDLPSPGAARDAA
jgi:hypothetical protein